MLNHTLLKPVLVTIGQLALTLAFVLGATVVTSVTVGVSTATEAKAVPRRVRRACKNDFKRLCRRYKIGTAKMRNCMRANGSQISWGCYEALDDYGYVSGNGPSSKRRGRRSRRRR